jgi:hypothetical protein
MDTSGIRTAVTEAAETAAGRAVLVVAAAPVGITAMVDVMMTMAGESERGGEVTARRRRGDGEATARQTARRRRGDGEVTARRRQLQGNDEATRMRRQLAMAPQVAGATRQLTRANK